MKEKRKQTTRACMHCRKSHACCSEKRPCDRCSRLELDCKDGTVARRGRKRQSNSSDRIQKIRKVDRADYESIMDSNDSSSDVERTLDPQQSIFVVSQDKLSEVEFPTIPQDSENELELLRKQNALLKDEYSKIYQHTTKFNDLLLVQSFEGSRIGVICSIPLGGPRKYKIVNRNVVMQNMLGFEPEDAMDWETIIEEKDLPIVKSYWLSAFYSRKESFFNHVNLISKNKTKIPVRMNTLISYDSFGRTPLFSVTFVLRQRE